MVSWLRLVHSVSVIVLCARTMAMELGAALYIKRVPTKDNLADDPSRERYGLLRHMGVSML